MRKLWLLFLAVCCLSTDFLCGADEKKSAAEVCFKEYLSIRRERGNTPEVRAKLQKAIALDPKNELYRYTELTESWGYWQISHSLKSRLTELNSLLDHARNFQESFPKSQRHVYVDPRVFHIQMWMNPDVDMDKNLVKEHLSFYSRYKKLVLQDTFSVNAKPAFDEEKGFTDAAELNDVLNYYAAKHLPFFYSSMDAWLNTRLQDALYLLPYLETYYAKHGKRGILEVNGALHRTCLYSLSNHLAWMEEDKKKEKTFQTWLSGTGEASEKLKASSIPHVRFSGYTLQTMRELCQVGINREKLKKTLYAYFDALNEINPGWMDGAEIPETGRTIDSFLMTGLTFLDGVRPKVFAELLDSYRTTHVNPVTGYDGISRAELIATLRNGSDAELKHIAGIIRKNAFRFICDREAADSLYNLPAASKDKIFDELNRSYRIKKMSYADFFHTKDELEFIDLEEIEGVCYLLLQVKTKKDTSYFLGVVPPVKQPKYNPFPFFVPVTKDVDYGKVFLIAYNSNTKKFVAAGKKVILIGDPWKGKWEKLCDTPSKNDLRLCGMTFCSSKKYGTRLYLAGCRDAEPRHVLFYSITPDGSDRKTYIDTASKPQKEYQGTMSPLFTFQNKIWFRLDSTLYSFDPETEAFQKEVKFSNQRLNAFLTLTNGMIYDMGKTRIDRYNPETKEQKTFISMGRDPDPAAELNIISRGTLGDSFILNSEKICFCGRFPYIMNLKKPATSPMIFLPGARQVAFSKDNVLFFARKSIYVIASGRQQ